MWTETEAHNTYVHTKENLQLYMHLCTDYVKSVQTLQTHRLTRMQLISPCMHVHNFEQKWWYLIT